MEEVSGSRRAWLLLVLGFAVAGLSIVLIPLLAGSDGNDSTKAPDSAATPSFAPPAGLSAPLPGTPSGPPAGKVQLLVTKMDEGTVAMRSPTFRCAADYCAGAVILGLEEILGEDNFKWGTGVVPNEDFVELRIRFDPARFSVEDIVAATRRAMEKYRDPGFPAGVEVVYVAEFKDFLPFIVSSERVVGQNRFVLALLDTKNELILDAKVRLRFFKLEEGGPVLKTEADAAPVTVTKSFVEVHADGTYHKHEVGNTGAYAADVTFDALGSWQVEVTPSLYGSRLRSVTTEFEVSETGIGFQIGDKAPASGQPTLADVDDISEIDSSGPPRTAMHTMTIAGAIQTGKPVVIAFATPAFCVSRVCGPVMDIVMDPLYEKYREQALFIHVEPYKLEEARAGLGLFVTDTMQEWGLKTEPWIFVVDGNGRIGAKFEGIVAMDEVEAALRPLVEGSP